MNRLLLLLCSGVGVGQKQRQINPDPVLNFDIFWQMYEEKYPFYDDKGIDWKAEYWKYRPQVSDTSSGETLFGIMSAMVAPLHDAHVLLTSDGTDKKSF
jgi:hypothetical protein